jgi:hypothetical protein
MADLMFKRGLASKLPAKTSATDGTFYLTTDTERLYVGVGSNLVELNKSIRTVSTQSSLPTSGVEIGDFYYITDKNIIAVCTATGSLASDIKWTQVNPDTSLSKSTANTSVSLSESTATVTNKITDTNGNVSTGSFQIEASGNLTMTVDGTKIKLEVPDGAKYDLTAEDSTTSNAVGIALTNQSDDTDKDTVLLKGNDNVTVSRDGNTIKIESKDPFNKSLNVESLSSTSTGTNKSGFKVNVVDGGGTVSGVVDPTVTYGDSTDTTSSAKFENGNLTLQVYTIGQTDSAIDTAVKKATSAFDAMEYKGTVSTLNALTGKTDQHIGYTYKASDGFTLSDTYSTTGNKVEVKTGDLLIAQGTEDSNGVITGTVKWDVIPSGDEQTITFSSDASTGVSKVTDGETATGYQVKSGNMTDVGYTVESTGTNKGVVVATVNHKTVTAPTPTAGNASNDVTQTSGDSATFTAITGLTEDGYGHVTGITTQKLTVVDTHNVLKNVDTTATDADTSDLQVANMGIKVNSSDGDGGVGTMQLTSKTLTLTSSNTAKTSSKGAIGSINVDLAWGEF